MKKTTNFLVTLLCSIILILAGCATSDSGGDDDDKKTAAEITDTDTQAGSKEGNEEETGTGTSFSDNGDGTVTDNVTGLIWEQKTVDNKDTTYTWVDAGSYCENLSLGSYSDWRLPDVKELQTIVDYGKYKPAIDETYFPNTASSGYWSSTTYAGNSDSAWGVGFYGGHVLAYGKSGNSYVHCVRGGSESVIGSFDYLDNGETITHQSTGLIWQKESDRQQPIWEDAISYCENLSLGGHSDWRLPNIKELQTIMDYGKYDPAIDETYFPNTAFSYYWSSTASADGSGSAWGVAFGDGRVDANLKSNSYYVRCVRGGSE